jgi:hypothetical protein
MILWGWFVGRVGGFEVVGWNIDRSAVGQLINQTQMGRGKYGLGRGKFLA